MKTMIFDLKKNAGVFVGGKERTHFDRWEKDRAVLYRGHSWDPVDKREYIYADGKKAKPSAPDLRASFDGKKITIGKKAFVVHPDDRKHHIRAGAADI